MGWEERRVVRASPTWSEGLVRFLTHPILAGLLLSIGGLALLLELRTPGLGIPGLIGVICLALYFGSHYLVSMAGNVELLLFLGGLLLIVLEIFVIPGFGVTGIAGIVMLVAGLAAQSRLPARRHAGDPGRLDAARSSPSPSPWASSSACSSSCPRPAGWAPSCWKIARITPIGYHADSHEGEPLLGKVGRSLTDLRPAGVIELEGRRLDVITSGDYIARGAQVKVIEIKGNRVVVERLETGEA